MRIFFIRVLRGDSVVAAPWEWSARTHSPEALFKENWRGRGRFIGRGLVVRLSGGGLYV